MQEEYQYSESANRARAKGSSLFVLSIFILIILLSIFIGNMLFGKNSLKVYKSLKKDKVILSKKISKLQKTNANLQKEYFELQSIMPQKSETDE